MSARLIGLILVVGLVLRLGAVLATPGYVPRSDAADFNRYGVSIAAGHGYPSSFVQQGGPTAYRPPVYPVFLGAVYKVFGNSVKAARLAQAVIGDVIVLLIGLIAFELWGRRAGIAATALAAVCPFLILADALLVSECIFTALVLAALGAVLAYRRRGEGSGLRWLIVAGLLTGLATLTRSNGLLLLIPFAIGVWPGRRQGLRRALAPVAVLVAATVVVIAPWTIRNASTFHTFVPVSTQDGYTLAGTYNATSRDDNVQPAAWRPFNIVPQYRALLADRSRNEAKLGQELVSRATRFARRHPAYVAEVGYRNAVRLFQLDGLANARTNAEFLGLRDHWVVDVASVGFWIFLALAVIGAFLRPAREAPLFVWLTPLVLLTTVFVVGLIRFRYPVDPFIVLLAALPGAAKGYGRRATEWRRGVGGQPRGRDVAGRAGEVGRDDRPG